MALWSSEYCSFMLESSPGKPYGSSLADLAKMEVNMKLRRNQVLIKRFYILTNDEW